MVPKKILSNISQYTELADLDPVSLILQKDVSFDTFIVFSPTREALFNWYGFRADSSLLCIGDICGALTGVFCKKCKQVTVLAGSYEEAELIKKRWKNNSNLIITVKERFIPEKYDYIVFFGIEYLTNGGKNITEYTRCLKDIVSILSDDGVLLIPTENRYGLKYFCGERDPISNTPFAGIDRTVSHSGGYMLSRKELLDAVRGIKDMKCKFYYPMPDHLFPQMIYSDEYPPSCNLKERAVPYSLSKETLVLSEKKLYDDIVDNNVFPFFSNSFLLECGKNADRFSDVIYAAVSADRGEKHGFATTIHQDGKVRKTALSKEGAESLKILSDNLDQISQKDIKIIEHTLCGDRIEMPEIKLPTLSEVLKFEIKSRPSRFIELFDILYDNILRSSEHSELKKSDVYHVDSSADFWGVILKKAYIDMIPINCFCDGDELMFFDQEFVLENYPAGYIMFRAIKYTYQFMPFADTIVPKARIIERYGLSEAWEYYEQVEKKFVFENRKQDVYGSFWQLSRIDDKTIRNNINRLSSGENKT